MLCRADRSLTNTQKKAAKMTPDQSVRGRLKLHQQDFEDRRGSSDAAPLKSRSALRSVAGS